MSKSKDRLMLEKLFNAAADNGLYEDSCDDGKELLRDLAKHLNKPLNKLCGDPLDVALRIYTDTFNLEDVFHSEDVEEEPGDEFTSIEVFVTRNGKRIKVEVSDADWYT